MTTANEVFEGQITTKVAGSDGSAATVYQFNLSGDDGGHWVVDLGAKTVEVGSRDEVDCTIDCPSADFVSMALGETSGAQLFMTGKLKVSGGMMYAMTLNKILS